MTTRGENTRQAAREEDRQPPRAPEGLRIDGFFGHGLLRPGIGKIVQRSGEPEFCGMMVCRLFGYTESPSKFDAARVSRRFDGEFFGVRYDGKHINAASGFVPSSIERALRSALDAGNAPVSWAGEIWCEPDEEGGTRTPLGYRFVAYDRRPRGAADPLMQIAAAAGIYTPPSHQLTAPDDSVDPETGEVREAVDRAA